MLNNKEEMLYIRKKTNYICNDFGFWRLFIYIYGIFIIPGIIQCMFGSIYYLVKFKPNNVNIIKTIPYIIKYSTTNGNIISISSFISIPLVIYFIFTYVKQQSAFSIKEYLAFKKPRIKDIFIWVSLTFCLMILITTITKFFDIESSDYVYKIYKTTRYPLLLWITLVIFFPIYEELLFRGFMFKGICQTYIGKKGALFFSTSIWAGIHLQYDLILINILIAFGILLGIARLKTKSIYIPIIMHILWNAIVLSDVVFNIK